MDLQKYARRFAQLLVILLLVGCGGSSRTAPLGTVTGVVTMDDKPLAKVEVSFTPVKGRPSVGLTDTNGKYDLIYVDNLHGALVGEHTVRITTYVEEDSPEAQNFKETIPQKYNLKSEMKETVKAGRNQFNYKLESK